MLCNRNGERVIDLVAGTVSSITLNWLLKVGFCGTCYLIMSQIDKSNRRSHLINKMSNETYYFIRCKSLEAFFSAYLTIQSVDKKSHFNGL